MAFDPNNPTDFEKFTTILRSDTLNTLRKRINGMLLQNHDLVDPDTGSPSSSMGATQDSIRQFIVDQAQIHFEWFTNFIVTGEVYTTRESSSNYSNINNGTIRVTLSNVQNEFTKKNGSYSVRIVWTNSSGSTISYRDFTTSSNTIQTTWTGVSSAQYGVRIIDLNADYVGVARDRTWKPYWVGYEGYSPYSHTYTLNLGDGGLTEI